MTLFENIAFQFDAPVQKLHIDAGYRLQTAFCDHKQLEVKLFCRFLQHSGKGEQALAVSYRSSYPAESETGVFVITCPVACKLDCGGDLYDIAVEFSEIFRKFIVGGDDSGGT